VQTHSQAAHTEKLQLLLAVFNRIDAKIKQDFNFEDLEARRSMSRSTLTGASAVS
jgi:hypothetical protein